MDGDLLGAAMGQALRWQAGLAVGLGLVGALALMVRAFALRVMEQFDQRLARIDRVAEDIRRLDDELSRLRAELPMHYIRRDDHIRDITAVSVKLDRIYELLIHRRPHD